MHSDVTLLLDHAIVRLKRSKINKIHQGVNILIISTKDSNYPITTLLSLIKANLRPPSTPLFRLDRGGFLRDALIKVLKSRL